MSLQLIAGAGESDDLPKAIPTALEQSRTSFDYMLITKMVSTTLQNE